MAEAQLSSRMTAEDKQYFDGFMFEVPEGCDLTGQEIADLRLAGLQVMSQTEERTSSSNRKARRSKLEEVKGIGQKRRRVLRRAPSVKLQAPALALADAVRGRQLMEAHENRLTRNGWIGTVAGYALASSLIAICSWFCIHYGNVLLTSSISGSAKACMLTFMFAILWHVLVVEWIPILNKLVQNTYPSVMFAAMIGTYTMNNWHEDYSDWITLDIMNGDAVLGSLLKAMEDIEYGD